MSFLAAEQSNQFIRPYIPNKSTLHTSELLCLVSSNISDSFGLSRIAKMRGATLLIVVAFILWFSTSHGASKYFISNHFFKCFSFIFCNTMKKRKKKEITTCGLAEQPCRQHYDLNWHSCIQRKLNKRCFCLCPEGLAIKLKFSVWRC